MQSVDDTTTIFGNNRRNYLLRYRDFAMYYNKDLDPKSPTTFAELEELVKDSKYAFEGEDGKTSAFLD